MKLQICFALLVAAVICQAIQSDLAISRLESQNAQIIKGCQVLTAILQQEDQRLALLTTNTQTTMAGLWQATRSSQDRISNLEHPPVITNPQWDFNWPNPLQVDTNLDLVIPNDILRTPKDHRLW